MVSCAADPQVVAARVAEGWQNIRLAMGNGQALNQPKEEEDYQNGTVSKLALDSSRPGASAGLHLNESILSMDVGKETCQRTGQPIHVRGPESV